ncbi:hypothetical protein [Nostoc commune]|nr:hypothetical protein [Nostoc commune]
MCESSWLGQSKQIVMSSVEHLPLILIDMEHEYDVIIITPS